MALDNVVISGIGGSFPKCNDLEEFKEALYERTNLITDMTPDWTGEIKLPHHLGRCKDLHEFDHTFLSISRAHASTMDKTCMKFSQYGYACVLDAGYSPAEVRGRNIGCYMHSTVCDDETRNSTGFSSNKLESPILVGVARTMHSNRISALFDFHGTSATHQGPFDGVFSTLSKAFEEVASGKVEAALVGACNLCVNPHPGKEFEALGLLTDDPMNKPLDDGANGYIRGDATVVLFLQRESDARKSYGQIVNVGTCFFGDRLGSFLSRDEKNIIKLLEDTYRECGLKPSDISYLETGSWANKDMDTQELKVIRKVFTEGRTDPLLIGSVVGNTGFCEGAAGFVALVKCIIALRTGVIAPTLHVEKPNAAIDKKMKIVTEETPCKEYVGANIFGMTGNFAHLILRKQENKPRLKYPLQDDLPRLYYMASRNIEDADSLFQKLDSCARSKYLAATMCDVFRQEIKGYMARFYAVYPYKKNKIQQFKSYEGGKRPVWFLFSGMGSQWQAMGKDLMKFPIFANAIAKCSAVLKEENVDLMNILTNEEDETIFDNILNSFVGIASIQIALVDVLFALGIKPDGMIGHSVGELGCAYADGCLTAEQAIRVALARGRASREATLIKGMMAAVGLGQSQVSSYLPPDIEVACRNSSTSCTLSGPTESVEKFVNALVEKGVFAKAVNVSNIAYHSRYIKPAAPLLHEGLKSVIPHPKARSSKWISTSIEEHSWNTNLAKYASAEYFTNNLLSAVYFEEGAHHIPKNAILIEIAPHGLLQAIVKKSLDSETVHIAMTNRSKSVDNIEFFLESIGQLYINGCEPDINALYPKIEYPIPASVPSISQFLTWNYSNPPKSGLTTGITKSWSKNVVLGICSKQKYQYMLNYKIGGKFVIPIASYIDFLLDFYLKKNPNAKSVAIENFRSFEVDTSVFLKEKVEISICITKVTGSFEITLERQTTMESIVLATGYIKVAEEQVPNIPEWKVQIGHYHFDSYLNNLNYTIPENQCVGHLTKYLEGFTGEILSKGRIFDLIDNCMKVVIIAKSNYKKPEVPYFIQSIIFNVESVREYQKGKSVQIWYDSTTNHLVSSAVVINKVKSKEFILDNPEPAKDYSGPISYFTSMNIANYEDVDVNYVGIANQLYSCESIVDYSGVTSSGNKIMGLVSYTSSMINFDKCLQWSVPSSWSLDEAVTVPLVYSMAYLCIIQKKSCYRTEKMKSVFIQCGDTALGEACIALALDMNKTVYTTVGSEEGIHIVSRRFPNLSPNHIFLNTNSIYPLALKLTNNGKGVDVIVNSLKQETHMNASFELLEMNGELIQVGVEETQSLGMRNFLNSQSFISLNSSMLLNCTEATKKEMHAFIEKKIRTGIIVPISSKINHGLAQQKSLDNDEDVSYHVVALNKRQTSQSPTLNVNLDSSYAIVGGNEAHHVLEWLMQRGARKFVIEFSNDFKINKLSPLLEKYGAILMVSRNNTTTLHGTEAFLADVRSLGDVAAVFAVNLSGEDCKSKLDNIKKVCDDRLNKAFLLSILCSENSKWHFQIKPENAKTVAKIVATLDGTLKNKLKYTVSSDVRGNSDSTSKSDSILDPEHLMDAHLPLKDIGHLYALYDEISQMDKPCFEEVVSLSLKKRFVKNVLPIFCFPGLSTQSMRKFITNSVYPSFLAHIPYGFSMDDIVSGLYKSLKEVQSEGQYTFVTESWSGIFALKLAEYLEKRGHKVTTILLDASPHVLKDIVQQHQELFSNEKNLAAYVTKKEGTLLLDAQKKTILERSCRIILDRAKHHVDTEVNHKFKGQCVIVTSEQSSSNSDIKDQYKMYKSISEIFMTSVTSPFEFSSDKEVVRFINEHVPVTWW